MKQPEYDTLLTLFQPMLSLKQFDCRVFTGIQATKFANVDELLFNILIYST